MEKVINDRIPHVGEKIFRSVDSDSLIQCLSVSTYWQELAKNELLKRWKRKIFEACKSGKTEIVKLLLEEEEIEDINAIDQSGGTAFMWACLNGHKDVVQLLLDNSEKNIDLNARRASGCTALMYACIYGRKDVVKLILDNSDRNIDLNARCDGGWTAFMRACAEGRKDVVKLLIEHSKTKEIDKLTGQEVLSDEMRAFIDNLQ